MKNQWLRMRHGHEISDHTADCAGFHRATTESFHTQDLPWRFSGKLHIKGSQRASSCVGSDSWLPLPALSYHSWNFSPPCTTVLQAVLVFIAQRSWVQLKGIKLHAQVPASQEQHEEPSCTLAHPQHWAVPSQPAGGWAATPWEQLTPEPAPAL